MEATKLDRQDWPRLALVMAVGLVLRVWIVANSEVCARDTIGFIRYARLLDEQPWGDVVRGMHQMPAYPAAILLISKPVLAVHPGPESEAYVLSAQLVSLLASVLSAAALYLAGRSLASRRAGFFAALLFQALPGWLQVTSDGLSEALFLMFAAWGLCFATAALRTPAGWRFALAGCFTGAAYLTRPEGLELFPATCAVVVVYGLTKWGWRATTLRLAFLAAGVLPFVMLYVAETGGLTNKPTSRTLLHGEETVMQPAGPAALPLAVFVEPNSHGGLSRQLTGLQMLAAETAKSLRYAGALLAVAGLMVAWRSYRFDPAFWLTLLLAGLHLAILWRMAVVIGYLSERHTLLFVLPALMWAGIALDRLQQFCLVRAPRLRFAPVAMIVCIGLSGIVSIAKPLHHNRAGHHAAGKWLAENARPQDELVDPFAWAHYYGGFFFREGIETPAGPKTKFIVMEPKNNHPRLPLVPLARQLSERGEVVFEWPEERPTVVVYRVKNGIANER